MNRRWSSSFKFWKCLDESVTCKKTDTPADKNQRLRSQGGFLYASYCTNGFQGFWLQTRIRSKKVRTGRIFFQGSACSVPLRSCAHSFDSLRSTTSRYSCCRQKKTDALRLRSTSDPSTEGWCASTGPGSVFFPVLSLCRWCPSTKRGWTDFASCLDRLGSWWGLSLTRGWRGAGKLLKGR